MRWRKRPREEHAAGGCVVISFMATSIVVMVHLTLAIERAFGPEDVQRYLLWWGV